MIGRSPPSKRYHHEGAGDCVGEPIERVAVAVQYRDRLSDFDEGAEQRQSDDEPQIAEARVGKATNKGECAEGSDMLEFVGGIAWEFRRVRDQRHDEGEQSEEPE